MKNTGGRLVTTVCLLAALGLALEFRHAGASTAAATATAPAEDPQKVTVDAEQAKQVHVTTTIERDFAPRVEATGRVDFDQDRLAQVTSPYAGRVRDVFVRAGASVTQGQPLFSVDSPDLTQAEGALVGAAGAREQTHVALQRAKGMAAVQANAPRDLEQAVADEQSAEGNYQAARRTLHLFGKNDAEIDQIAAGRKVDGVLRIDSPIAGVVSQRNVAPGDLLQPGTGVPFTIGVRDSLWLVADVPENDAVQVRVGQPMTATVAGRPIDATVSYVADSSDANTHRVTVRAVLDKRPEGIRAQMLAAIAIRTAAPERHIAVPEDAVVRESDGGMVVFTTDDGLTFTRRPVHVGEPRDGYYPVLSGLPGHGRIAAEGALFLSNALALRAR